MSLLLAVANMLVPVAMMTPAVVPPSASNATTPLELGLAERACGIAAYSSVTESDVEKPCVSTQLAALRADFGRDLTGLSPRERRGLDGACTRLNTPLARDRYLDCLNTELEMMRSRRRQANAATASTPGSSAAHTANAHRGQPALLTFILVAAGLAVVIAAGSVAFLIVRRRNAQVAPANTSAASA